MISFSYWYLKSREGICLVFVLGVTAIATWLHRGDIHLADKSGAIKEQLLSIRSCGKRGDLPVHRQYC